MKKVLKSMVYGIAEKFSRDPLAAKFHIRKHFVGREKLYQTCYSASKRKALLDLFGDMVKSVPGDVAECGCYAGGAPSFWPRS